MARAPDFLLGVDEAGQPVYLPDSARDEHTVILGATGTGKSTLLQRLVLHDLATETSCIVIDAHGDITRGILDRASPEAHLYQLAVWPDRPFGLNLLELDEPAHLDKRAEEALLVFKRVFQEERAWQPQLEHDLRLLFRTLLASDCTLVEALDLLTDAAIREQLIARVTEPMDRASWKLLQALSTRDLDSRLQPLFSRLQPLLASRTIRCIVGQSRTTAPLDEVLNIPGFALLVSLPIGGSGSEAQSRLLGSLLVCALSQMVFERINKQEALHTRLHIYLDEYGRFATNTTARFFSEARKFNVGLTVAHQTMADVQGTDNDKLEFQAGAVICFHPVAEDAEQFAKSVEVKPRPAQLERITETDGTEPELAICQDPVSHLTSPRGGHRSPIVRSAAREVLQPAPGGSTETTRRQIGDQQALINRLLVDVMEGRVKPDTPSFFDAAAKILNEGAMSRHPAAGYWPYVAEKEYRALTQAYVLQLPLQWNLLRQARPIIELPPLQEDRYKRMPFNPSFVPRSTHKTFVEAVHNDDLAHRSTRYEDLSKRPGYQKDLEARARSYMEEAARYIHYLYVLCENLAADPIMVPSGQTKPRIRVRYERTPEQSVKDARDTLANNLFKLAKGEAYLKLRSGVKTPVTAKVILPEAEPQEGSIAYFRNRIPGMPDHTPSPAFEYRLEKCKEWFGTPREQVEREIRQRRERTLPPAPPRSQDNPDPPRRSASNSPTRVQEQSKPGLIGRRTPKPPLIGRRSPPKKAPQPEPQNIRVSDLAQELGVAPRMVMSVLKRLGVQNPFEAFTIEPKVADQARQMLEVKREIE
ncbi:helicase HerA domain-containing protein [Kitasatospora sp. NPDC048194]|uniref:type IV secretory system conjugative DNA transfer family protein n=1 Tax=Kitasatospora sp. NPDC048194 TaxID=3364045 RepID=UPI003716AC00